MKLLVVSTLCVLVAVCVAQDAYNQEALTTHNGFRAKHGAAALKYSATLQATAQYWANYLASANVGLKHSTSGHGENLAWTSASSMAAHQATTMWYNEISNYDFATGKSKNGGVIGHFTQVVWKGSKEIGVAKVTSAKGTFVVANYSPPGNYVGQNVKQVG